MLSGRGYGGHCPAIVPWAAVTVGAAPTLATSCCVTSCPLTVSFWTCFGPNELMPALMSALPVAGSIGAETAGGC
jgi:hypothetical protein